MLTLFGTVTNKRKLDTRGKYDAIAFDLEIEDVQKLSCAAFGRSAGQVKRIMEDGWARITGEFADLNLERRVTGLKVTEALSLKAAPQIQEVDARIVDIELGIDGRRGSIEILDTNGISWALDGQSGRLADAARGLKSGLDVRATFRCLPVLVKHHGEMQPIMSSILNSLAVKAESLAAA